MSTIPTSGHGAPPQLRNRRSRRKRTAEKQMPGVPENQRADHRHGGRGGFGSRRRHSAATNQRRMDREGDHVHRLRGGRIPADAEVSDPTPDRLLAGVRHREPGPVAFGEDRRQGHRLLSHHHFRRRHFGNGAGGQHQARCRA